jgi:hypothetical protein
MTTMMGLGIAAWTLSGILIGSLVWMVVKWRERRKVVVGAVVGLAAILGLVIVAFAGMGAFCVPPPGAACL